MNQLGFHGRSRFPSLGPGPSPQTSQAEENFNPFRTIPGSIMQSNYVRWNQPWDSLCFCVKTWLHFDAEPGLLGEGRVMRGDAFIRVWVQGIMTCLWKGREFCVRISWRNHRFHGVWISYVSYVFDQLLRPQIRTALNGSHWMFSGWRNWHE